METIAKIIVLFIIAYGICSFIFWQTRKNSISIRNYLSRFLFRIILIIHLITAVSLPSQITNKYLNVISQADELVLLLSLLLLSKSFQDFLDYAGRKNRTLRKAWPPVSISLLTINCAVDIFSSVKYVRHRDDDNDFYIYIYLHISHFLVTILLIVIPIIHFLFEIKHALLSSGLRKKINLLIVLMMIFIILLAGFQFFLIIYYFMKKFDVSPNGIKSTLINALNSFSYLNFFFVQDAFDWALNWICENNASSSEIERDLND